MDDTRFTVRLKDEDVADLLAAAEDLRLPPPLILDALVSYALDKVRRGKATVARARAPEVGA